MFSLSHVPDEKLKIIIKGVVWNGFIKNIAFELLESREKLRKFATLSNWAEGANGQTIWIGEGDPWDIAKEK